MSISPPPPAPAAAELGPTTAEQRAAKAAANRGEPTLDFTGISPYDAYVRASTLHTLQRPLSSEPGEMSFLMVSQIMELYFGLICFELCEARRALREDDLPAALAPLNRAVLHLTGLNATWHGLSWMTPADFNRFRDLLGEASGFQSAMYRRLEFVLGFRSTSLIRPFRRQPEVYQALVDEMRSRSIWDETIALLARRGFDIPHDLLERDFTEEHRPHEAVEAAWVTVYREDTPDLRRLGDALAQIAEGFSDWRYEHLKAVKRAMGEKPGSGGSSGVAWLQRSLARVVFPELWSARTII